MAAVTARREEIARIIDPEAWAISDGSATGTQIAASLDALERWRVASLAKADAILATDGQEIVKELVTALTDILALAEEELRVDLDSYCSPPKKGEEHDIETIDDRWDYARIKAAQETVRATRAAHAKAKDWLEEKNG